jgi:hypothetical protein
MPIPTGTAAISFSQLRTEMHTGLGNPAAYGTFPLNDGTFRSRLTDTATNNPISLSSLRGNAYQRFTIAADNSNSPYDIRGALIAGGWNGTSKGSADVLVNSGVVVSSTTTGAYAMDTGGPWPGPSTIVVYNNGGYIIGMGGNGGVGQRMPSGPASVAGSAGGPSLRAQRAMTLVNSGTVGGGGGGGGGGDGKSYSAVVFPGNPPTPFNLGGGGGGGGRTGRTNSAGGPSNTPGGGNPSPGKAGAVGTFAGGGNGGAAGTGGPQGGTPGAGPGGDGGDWGTAGGTGGRSGKAGGAAGISVQGWSLVTAPTGSTGISGPTTAG